MPYILLFLVVYLGELFDTLFFLDKDDQAFQTIRRRLGNRYVYLFQLKGHVRFSRNPIRVANTPLCF